MDRPTTHTHPYLLLTTSLSTKRQTLQQTPKHYYHNNRKFCIHELIAFVLSRQTRKRDKGSIEQAHKTHKQGKKAHNGENKHVNKQTNKKGYPRRANVGLDLVSVVPLDWSIDNTCAIEQSSSIGLGILCKPAQNHR